MSSGMESDVILRMQGITKRFPGVLALNQVTFDQKKGEIHSLIGENGAGKSTLMKVLGGAYIPDGGDIELFGENVSFHSPQDALSRGVSVIYQEFNLVPTLSIADNIFLGKEITTRLPGRLSRRDMEKKAHDALDSLGLGQLDTRTPVRDLSVAQQQLVEIGKAFFNDARLLVMDEPTAVLSQDESERLFRLMRGLQDRGISIIYISHRLDEVLELSDRITVLRDGEIVTTYDNTGKAITKDELTRSMVGRDLEDYYPERRPEISDDLLLSVSGLSRDNMFRDVSFNLRKGEILGFYGLVGAGRTEIMRAVVAADPRDTGEIRVEGRTARISHVGDSIAAGLALIPEDRKREGFIAGMSVAENIGLPNLDSYQSAGIIRKQKLRELVKDYIARLSIRPPDGNRQVRFLSGGNQQKAVIAKWLAGNPRIIIFDEPTRGIDVGAKSEIYQIIAELAERGVGVIIISSEILEILGMCDRILVVHNGEICREFDGAAADQEQLVRAASGL